MEDILNYENLIYKVINSMNIIYPYCLEKQDLVQEVYLRFLTKGYWEKFNAKKGLKISYLSMVIRQTVISCLCRYSSAGHRGTLRNLKQGIMIFNFERLDNCFDQIDIYDSIENKDILERILARIGNISNLHRQVFELRLAGYSLKEISLLLEIKSSRIKRMSDYCVRLGKIYWRK